MIYSLLLNLSQFNTTTTYGVQVSIQFVDEIGENGGECFTFHTKREWGLLFTPTTHSRMFKPRKSIVKFSYSSSQRRFALLNGFKSISSHFLNGKSHCSILKTAIFLPNSQIYYSWISVDPFTLKSLQISTGATWLKPLDLLQDAQEISPIES